MQSQSKLLKWSLILGIVIVTNLFVNYSISLVYNQPQYSDFCTQTYAPTPASEAEQTICSNDFTTAMNTYEANIFIVLVAIGAALIITSFFLKTNPVVSTALSFAGLLSLVIASMRYWSSANNWLKVLILGVALAALIALALRKFKTS
jgi:hypothetical protein